MKRLKDKKDQIKSIKEIQMDNTNKGDFDDIETTDMKFYM